jgi:spectinomycin phosphotransferase
MLERPNLPDRKIIECLQEGYHLPVSAFEFLPIGNDAATWVYRATSKGGESYFVKLRKGKPYEPSVMIPRYLKDSGMAQLIEPLRTQAGALWQGLDGFTLFVYPFVDGRSGMVAGLTDTSDSNMGRPFLLKTPDSSSSHCLLNAAVGDEPDDGNQDVQGEGQPGVDKGQGNGDCIKQ